MKKLLVLVIIVVVGVYIFADGSLKFFNYNGSQWTTSYSQQIGNVLLLENIGTTSIGGAIGFSNTIINRERMGFLDLMVGKTSYSAAIGFTINPLTPVGYFEYETMRTIAPVFYDLNMTLGNYTLSNFAIDLNGRTQFVFSNISLYAQTHFYLLFSSDFQGMADVDLSYYPVKGSFLVTNEIGNLYFLTGGYEFRNLGLSVDLGAGFNSNGVAPGIGFSSAQPSLDNSWTFRIMPSNGGVAFYTAFRDQNEKLTLGYNLGAVYLSFEN